MATVAVCTIVLSKGVSEAKKKFSQMDINLSIKTNTSKFTLLSYLHL